MAGSQGAPALISGRASGAVGGRSSPWRRGTRARSAGSCPWLVIGGGVRRQALLLPSAGGHAKALPESTVEVVGIVETALHADGADLDVRVEQQLAGTVEPEIAVVAQRAGTELFTEQPAEVHVADPESASELTHVDGCVGMCDEFVQRGGDDRVHGGL